MINSICCAVVLFLSESAMTRPVGVSGWPYCLPRLVCFFPSPISLSEKGRVSLSSTCKADRFTLALLTCCPSRPERESREKQWDAADENGRATLLWSSATLRVSHEWPGYFVAILLATEWQQSSQATRSKCKKYTTNERKHVSRPLYYAWMIHMHINGGGTLLCLCFSHNYCKELPISFLYTSWTQIMSFSEGCGFVLVFSGREQEQVLRDIDGPSGTNRPCLVSYILHILHIF